MAPAAQGATNQVSIMQDDDLLLYRNDDTRDSTLRHMKSLGVDVVRVTLLWDRVAEDAQRTKALRKRFKKLGADDPRAYPRLNWDRYDRLVRAGRTLNIGVYINITGPGPTWGHRKAPKGQKSAVARAWRPKEREFYKFVQAVGKRYNGKYRDENDGRQKLPKVFIWSLWNEPNQAGWLAPQWVNNKAVSPGLYRKLWFYGRRALISTGHGNDYVYAGETAPIGQRAQTTKSAMRPKTFLRKFFCLDRPDAGCSDYDKYGPVRSAAFAHHPYTKKNSPFEREKDPEALTLANIGELENLLDEAASRGRIAPNQPIISSEFGYETSPPDPFQGISMGDQANNLVLGEFLTYNNPRIIGHSQFLLRDAAPVRKHTKNTKAYWFTYQSGLYNRSGKVAKPSVDAWKFPFLAATTAADLATGARTAMVWGFLRFRPNNLPTGFQDFVQIQFRPSDGSSDWYNLGTPIAVTNGSGYFVATMQTPSPGAMRAVWQGSQSPGLAISSLGVVQ